MEKGVVNYDTFPYFLLLIISGGITLHVRGIGLCASVNSTSGICRLSRLGVLHSIIGIVIALT